MVSYKSSFFEQAKDKLDVYKNELTSNVSENIETCFTKEFVLIKEWGYNKFLLDRLNRIHDFQRKTILKKFEEGEKK